MHPVTETATATDTNTNTDAHAHTHAHVYAHAHAHLYPHADTHAHKCFTIKFHHGQLADVSSSGMKGKDMEIPLLSTDMLVIAEMTKICYKK